MGYLTLSEAPSTTTCLALFVPDSKECLAIVRGALQALTIPDNWDVYGILTPEESAEAFESMFLRFLAREGSCRLIGEIVLYAGTDNPYPDLWLVCDGNERLVADFPDLFAVIGHTYGEHDAEHFWLPNLSLHVAMGAAPESDLPIGTYIGTDDYDLIEENIPQHAHDIPQYATDLAVGGGELVVIVPTEDMTETGEWGAEEPERISNYQPSLCMAYFIVAKGG